MDANIVSIIAGCIVLFLGWKILKNLMAALFFAAVAAALLYYFVPAEDDPTGLGRGATAPPHAASFWAWVKVGATRFSPIETT